MSNENSPHHQNEASFHSTLLDEMNAGLANNHHLSSASPSQPAQVPHTNGTQSTHATNLQSKKMQLKEEIMTRKRYLDAMSSLPSEHKQTHSAELSHLQQYLLSVDRAIDEAAVKNATSSFNKSRAQIREWELLVILVQEFSSLLNTIIKMLQAHQKASEKALEHIPNGAINLQLLISKLEDLQLEVEKDSRVLHEDANAGVESFMGRLNGMPFVAAEKVMVEDAKAKFEQIRVTRLTQSLDTYAATLPADKQQAHRLRQGVHLIKEKFVHIWKAFLEKLGKSTLNENEAVNATQAKRMAMENLKTQTATLFDEVTSKLGIKGRYQTPYHLNASTGSEMTIDPAKARTITSSRGRLS